MKDTTSAISVEQDFFIPDLCRPQALFFLILVGQLVAFMLALAGSGLSSFDWRGFALLSLFVQWNMLLDAALLCQLRRSASQLPINIAAGLCYGAILFVVILTSVIGQWLLNGAFSGTANWTIDPWLVLSNSLICAVLAGISLRYFYLTRQLRMQQQTELQARIQALQSRIRPHFLFNSMNIIASLIAVDQRAAETAVEDLAELFRASLNEVDTEVTLAEEIALCEKYARIEQLRLGERLHMDWQLDQLPAQLPIPSLSLQPLLENAIYHGIAQVPEGGAVTINGRYDDGEVVISVTNPIPDIAAADNSGNHMAQSNIHHRLQALYGAKAGLSSQHDQNIYTTTIRYPVTADKVSQS